MAKNETTEGAAPAAAQTQQLSQPEPSRHTPHPSSPAHAVGKVTEAEPAPPKIERIPPKPLGERYFQMRETRQTEWFATVNADVTPEDCLKREFWSQIFPKVAHGSRICVFAENRSWYGEMIVFGIGIGWVEARWIVGPVRAPAGVVNYSAASDYEVRELGEIKKWGVLHRADGRVIHSGELTQEAAGRWLAEYLRSQMTRAA